MYLFSFGARRFEQSVFSTSLSPTLQAGDLLQSADIYYLCLGEEIAWPEFYGNHSMHLPEVRKISHLLQTQSLQLIHRLVNEYYTSYTSALPLRLGNDIIQIISKKKNAGSKRPSESDKNILTPQRLSIFPSLRAAQTAYPVLNENMIILSGQSTTVQRAKAYWGIKNGSIGHVIATHSQIFRDRQHLAAVDIYDPLSYSYETHADPRYRISDIVSIMSELYTLTPHSHGLQTQRSGISHKASNKIIEG